MRRLLFILLLLTLSLIARAQRYADDFENQYTWYPPWTNIVIAVDSSDSEPNHVCLCDTTEEYGLGLIYPFPDTLAGHNLNVHYEADYRFPDTLGKGEVVFTITHDETTVYWYSYDLARYANDSARWFHVSLDFNIPADYLEGHAVKTFLWKKSEQRIFVDNALVQLTPWTMPSFLPDIGVADTLAAEPLLLLGLDSLPLTRPIGMVVEYLLDGDTLCEFNPFVRQANGTYLAVSAIDSTYTFHVPRDGSDPHRIQLGITSSFHQDCKLLRQSLVIPFVDSSLTVYRSNLKVDTVRFQDEYYLDREGFQVGRGERSVIVYHETGISSLQLDALHRTAFFNLDYWRDHPLIHYPLSDSLEDHFEDRSCQSVHEWTTWYHTVTLNVGYDQRHLPRIMPIPQGYESGIIFTEHADWADLRTHRATYFGNEHIRNARQAIGGFVYYGIPVTKSVFYNNPDRVTNAEASHGAFPGLQATIKTDRDFEQFLVQLYRRGYDICLHTPEQYTTTPSNLDEALRYMERKFHSVTWIDHGYNNGSIHNREDLVCDGLNPESEAYSAGLWSRYGIKYLWNAYYEENRMEPWCFDNNLMQPYPGFGDALPHRQLSTLNSQPSTIYLWSTPSTLDAHSDADWDFYYHPDRLARVVENHDVHITHVYPAWTNPARAFWTYDEDSTIVVLPGMDRALGRIAQLREERKMLPMTVKTYLDHYNCLSHLRYEIIDAHHIAIQNTEDACKGFTLVCPTPIWFEDQRFYDYRKVGDGYYVWFDLKPWERVIILINE